MKAYLYDLTPPRNYIELAFLPAIMFEGENLCANKDEEALGEKLRWLNSENVPYYLKVNPCVEMSEDGFSNVGLAIVIFDHAKAALFQIVFDVPEPEIVDFYWTAADEAEAEREKQKAAREELEARLLAEAEAARRAREYRPPVITEAAPVVRKPLMARFMDSLRKMGEFQ